MKCLSKRYLALRAKFKFETDVFFMILRSKIMKNTSVSKEYSAAEGGKNLFTEPRVYVKILFMALRAKLYYERQVIFTISRSEIVKMTCLSREDSAAVGGKILFMQRQVIF